MPPENTEENERKPQPPSWWKAPSEHVQAQIPDPAITRHVLLPEKVAVKYLADVSAQELSSILALMDDLRIIIEGNRSVDFADAAKILRRYGIAAERNA